jgi:hypothetical protein
MIPEVYRLTDVLESGFPLSAFQIVPGQRRPVPEAVFLRLPGGWHGAV